MSLTYKHASKKCVPRLHAVGYVAILPNGPFDFPCLGLQTNKLGMLESRKFNLHEGIGTR